MKAVDEPADDLPPAAERREPVTIGERWFRFRNQLLANPRFQRWAAEFPLTRFLARRRAAALFDLCAGFVYSQVLHASVKLGLFDLLASGPLTAPAIAHELSLPLDGARRLLSAAAALGLTQRTGPDEFGLGVHGASLLGNPGAVSMVKHHALLYRDLADPVALLRGEQRETELSRFWPYSEARDFSPDAASKVADYTQLMAESQSLVASDILAAYPISRHKRLLDIGGGDGSFLEAAAEHAPELELMLFDLPAVAARARSRISRKGLAKRARAVGGDLFRDPLPEGADVVSLLRVIHDHDDQEALKILRAARRALPLNGIVLVAEPMSETPGAEPMGDAYFGFYLLAMGHGRPRTIESLSNLLLQAGFADPREIATRQPMLTRLIAAINPQSMQKCHSSLTENVVHLR